MATVSGSKGRKQTSALVRLSHRGPRTATRYPTLSKNPRGASGANASPTTGIGFNTTPKAASRSGFPYSGKIGRTGKQYPGGRGSTGKRRARGY